MSELTDKQKIDILNYSIEEAKEIIEDLRNQNAELREELDLKDKVIDKILDNHTINLISKLQKDIEIKDKVIDLMADKLSERSEWYTKERWKEICYKQVEEKDE